MTELIIVNARVITMESEQPYAEAIAVSNNRISAVGTSEEIKLLATSTTRVVDAAGRTVLPGFVDSHVHLFQGSAELDFLALSGITELSEVAPLVQEYANARPDEPLVLGVAAFYELFMGNEKSPREMLDDIMADRPFALLAADIHTVWANTLTLEKAGLLHGAEVPVGCSVVMGDDGLANGTLFEAGAFGPALALSRTGGRDMVGYVTGNEPVPTPTPAQREEDKNLLLKGIDHVAKHGITALSNMDGNFYQLELLSELEAEGRLKVRIQVPFHFKNYDPIERLEEAAVMHAKYSSGKVWSGRVKMFMDGVLESRTGLKKRAYPDDLYNHGDAIFTPERFNEACQLVDEMGLQISVHAIGDLAVQRVLDGYEYAQQKNGKRDSRHRIEHIELITDDDLKRLKPVGVVASLQPRHAAFAGYFEPPKPNTVFFDDECAKAFAWQTIRDTGTPVVFSTDWPVVPVSVLENIQCAVAPIALGGDWVDQSQSLHNTLESYTAAGAWMGFKENLYGRLKPGLAADIVVLNGSIEECEPTAIGKLGIALTVCDGEITYENGSV